MIKKVVTFTTGFSVIIVAGVSPLFISDIDQSVFTVYTKVGLLYIVQGIHLIGGVVEGVVGGVVGRLVSC